MRDRTFLKRVIFFLTPVFFFISLLLFSRIAAASALPWSGIPSCLGAFSGSHPGAEKVPPVEARLLLLDSDFSKSIKAGIYFEIDPDWYLYWINPGEAGLPPEVSWDLPAGFLSGDLLFPTPQKFMSSGQVTYGFKGGLLLICEIETPADFRFSSEHPLIISARIDWMACRESCTLGGSDVSLNLSEISPAELEKAEKIRRNFQSLFPQSSCALDVSAQEIKIEKTGSGRTVEITLAGKDVPKIMDFYPHPVEGFIMNQKRAGFSDGKIELALTPSGESAMISKISGLLIIDNSGYEISIPVPLKK